MPLIQRFQFAGDRLVIISGIILVTSGIRRALAIAGDERMSF